MSLVSREMEEQLAEIPGYPLWSVNLTVISSPTPKSRILLGFRFA